MANGIFLDRDGTLNVPVLHPDGKYGAPFRTEDLKLFPYTIESLRKLQDSGYDLFLVSNQPDYAKGNTTLDVIHKVHEEFDRLLKSEGVHFKEYFYCYHHPKGVVPGYSYECECRKPKPFFLLEAARKYQIDLSRSWMVGDRDVDVECGQAARTKTILIEEPLSAKSRGRSKPDFRAKDFEDATNIILSEDRIINK